MKVSVILPNYNHQPYLEKRISSILEQSYQDYEIIILDDCSSDNSREVLERYRADPRVSSIIYEGKNTGSTFKQWDKGISRAKGELIWIAESDDWCEPNFLEILVSGMDENPGCTVAYAQSYCVDNEGNIKWQTKYNKLKDCIEGDEFIERFLLKNNSICNASMAIFKKDGYYKIAKQFQEFHFCGDWLFWIELAAQGKVFISGRLLNYFRKHDNDISGKAYKTGYYFIERFRLLAVLKNRKIISEFSHKNLFLAEYNAYRAQKINFRPGEVRKIEAAINNDRSALSFIELSNRETKKSSMKGFIKKIGKKILD